MKLYQYKYGAHGFVSYSFGYIANREVDTFNNKIKVFVEVGNYENNIVRMNPFWVNNKNSYNVTLASGDNWSYISEVDIEEVPEKVKEYIKKACEDNIEKNKDLNKELEKLLKSL